MKKIFLLFALSFLPLLVHAAPTATYIYSTSTPGCINVASSGLLWSSGTACGGGSSGGSSFGQSWELTGSPIYLAPTTTRGIGVFSSSTISALTVTTGTTTNATSTNLFATTASSTNLFTSSALIATTSQSQSSLLSITGNVFSSGTVYANNFLDTSVGGSACIGETNGLLGTSNCVSSIASAGGTLTVSSPTGNVDVSINLAHVNTWSATQTFGNIIVTGSSTLQNFTGLQATTTQATTTSFFATTASTTNFFGAGLTTGCNGFSGFVQWGSGLFSCATLATGWSTSSSAYFNTQFRDWSVQGTTYIAPTSTLGIIVNASSTINSNLVISGNSTTTSATTTNSFSTTASSTNLFTQNLQANIKTYLTFTVPTTTPWTGTTTVAMGTAYVAEIWNGVVCFTDAGTLNVDFYFNSTHIKTPDTKLNASTTNNINIFNTNTSLAQGVKRYVDIGTPASSPTYISCTVSRTYLSN